MCIRDSERNGEVVEKEIPIDFISKLIERGKDSGPFLRARYPFVVGKISEDSPNVDGELKVKDIIVGINGTPITYYDEAKSIIEQYKSQDITLTVKRGDETLDLHVKTTDKGAIGVVFAGLSMVDLEKLGYYELENNEFTFAEAIPAGLNKSWSTLTGYIKQLKKIFNPSTGAYKGLGGFISIGSIFPSEWSAETFWNITAFLSIMLGFMNLLPIPALDGGHVVFTLWEMITGKKPGDKFLEYAQITGFILLIALLLFANGNDIFRLFK